MKIVIAPDSFKECMGAEAVARAIAEGIASVCPGAELVCLPLADGGEGTAGIVTRALGGNLREVPVHGPMGRPVTAFYGRVGDTVILDVASAIGVPVVLLSGRIKDDSALREAGFSRLVQVTPEGTPLQEALREEVARENLIRSAAGWAASALI